MLNIVPCQQLVKLLVFEVKEATSTTCPVSRSCNITGDAPQSQIVYCATEAYHLVHSFNLKWEKSALFKISSMVNSIPSPRPLYVHKGTASPLSSLFASRLCWFQELLFQPRKVVIPDNLTVPKIIPKQIMWTSRRHGRKITASQLVTNTSVPDP